MIMLAHVIMQDICDKIIEIHFCVGCMVSQPNCLLQDSTTMSLIDEMAGDGFSNSGGELLHI